MAARSAPSKKRVVAPRKPALLSKEQREAIERELAAPYSGGAKLQVDGHELSLRVERYKALKWCVIVYVDGCLRGEWYKAESEIGAKFWRRRVSVLIKQKDLALYRKAFGKRDAEARLARATFVMHSPDFPSARSFLAHIQRTATAVEVVSVGYQPEAPEAANG